MNVTPNSRAGLVWRWDGSVGGGLTLDSGTDMASIFHLKSNAGHFIQEPIEEYSQAAFEDQGPRISKAAQQVRIFLRAYRAELYLNDRFIFAVSYPEGAAKGGIGLSINKGTANFRNLRIADIKPIQETITYLKDQPKVY